MRRFGLVLFVLLTPSALFAWGKDGHQIVALVAQAKIQPATAAAVKTLLGAQTLADIAPLPDVWRAEETATSHPRTELWHFTDIPTTKITYVPDRDCPKIANNEVDRNCVIAAIDHFQTVLADTHAPAAARVRALTFVVHFVGDVHQPLHSTSRFTNGHSDRGANGVKASFPGMNDSKENLHHVWDDDLIASEHRTPQQAYVQHLLNDILPTLPAALLAEKSDVAWATSAHQLAVQDAYKYPGTSLTFAPIDAAYVTKNTKVADEQLTLAGIHLAHVLDAALAGPAPAAAHAAALAPAGTLPHPDHVVVVLMENKSYGDVIGSANAPYLNSLPARGALLTKYYGLHHPSQPNYIELFSGKEQGVCNDHCPPPPITAPNLAASLLAANKTFVGYAENLPANLTTCSAGNYARKHCPWLDFTGIPASVSRDFTSFPTTAAAFASLPSIAFVIPNLLDDMHSAATSGGSPIAKEVAQGDAWLRAHLDAYATWAVTHNSLLVITWDEDSSNYTTPSNCASGINTKPPANHIPTLVLGAHVVPGSTSSTPYTHYDLLRTLEDLYGLSPIGGSAGVPPISGIWAP